MISSKVQTELRKDVEFLSKNHMAKRVGKFWRVYADATGYSQTTGQTLAFGKVERDADGKPVKFASVEDAEKWIEGGKIIFPKVQFGAGVAK